MVIRNQTVSSKEFLRRFLHQEYGGQRSVAVTIDGKTLRSTVPKGKTQAVHLLAAYLPGEGVTSLQTPVANKENEVVVAPRLLEVLDLNVRVVCGDATITQRTLRLIPDEHHFVDWPGLQQVFQLERRTIQQNIGEISTETVHGITSLLTDTVTTHQLLD